MQSILSVNVSFKHVPLIPNYLATNSKELKPICHPTNCYIPSNSTDCITQILPKHMDLSETFCETCKSGSRHVVPAVVQRRVCRHNIRGTKY